MPDEEKKDSYEIKDSGTRREFGTGAVRDMSSGKGRFDLLPWATIKALAIHYEKGCQKYGDRNWEKGIPVKSFCDSAVRHLAAVIDGSIDDENHLISVLWNVACAYETILRIQLGRLPKELYDLPCKITLPFPYDFASMKCPICDKFMVVPKWCFECNKVHCDICSTGHKYQ